MALIKCSECGKEISDKAKACIHCGCPISEQNIPHLEMGCVLCPNCGWHFHVNKNATPDNSFSVQYHLNNPCNNCGSSKIFLHVIDPPHYKEKEKHYEYFNKLAGGTINKNLHDKWVDEAVQQDLAQEAKRQAELLTHAECPYCKSRQTEKASATSRWLSTGLFGLASRQVGKQWYCRNCKSYF